MIETTARRERRTAPTRTRLDHLVTEAGSAPSRSSPADDVPWPDVLTTSPDAPTWWPSGSTLPTPDHHPPQAPEQPATARLPDADGLPPRPHPWWRRRLNRLLERWLPQRAPDPPRWRLAMLVAGAVLLGVSVAVGFTLSSSNSGFEVPPALPAASVSEVSATTASVSSAADEPIVISVVGRVSTPGLVTVPQGARVADALAAAGGPVPGTDLTGLNIARRLADGEQIYVGVTPPPGAAPPGAGGGQPGAGPVDLNSASLTTLDTLPGVGPVTAQRIVDWRTEHGRFASVDQLSEIEGIGPSRFDQLKDLVVAR